MEFSLTEVIRTYLRHYRTRKFLRKFARVLGCIVAFVTTYALILPAITMEQESFCGFEEHTHTEACYQMQIQNRQLVCNGPDSGLHVHSGSCYSADGVVLCGQADYVVHNHNDSCRDGSGALICTMAERAQHSHGDSCYRTPEPVPHTHKDICTELVKGELLCTQQEDPGHQHGTGCYQPGTELVCTKTAGHQHTEECYIAPLICTLSTDPHSHDGHCYTRGTLLCNVPENHVHQGTCFETNIICGLAEYDHSHDSACYVTDLVCTEAHEEHTDGCWETRLSCGMTEGGHHHTDSCKTVTTVCTTQEGHTHGDGCYEKNLTCGKTEGEVHSHGSGCYDTEKKLNCSLDENHIHENACYKQELFCEIPESEGHAHGDSCYQWDTQYICGLEEGAPETGEKELVCTEPSALVHVHGDGCFAINQTDAAPVCGMEHDHTFTCYSLICTLEEHTHTLQCYSNPDADVENVSDWKNTINDLELTGDWNLDVVAVAESQLGYQESTRNYTVWEDNTLHGYTRYGAWYGVPNGDWCGMFASFCLHYGGVKGMPYNYGTRPWITDLSKLELDLYRTAEEYIPIPGDLVFFDWDPQDGLSDHVGIVYEVTEATETQNAKLKTIEGNSSNRVQFVTYDLDSPVLLGYSMLPENPKAEYDCDFTKHVHNKRDCYDEQDDLICEKTVHIHSKDCISEKPDEPVYFCGLEVHVHEEICYDEAGELTCQQPEHEHMDACQIEKIPEPIYYCGQEEHIHGDGCYDETGGLICEQAEHTHEDACLTEPPVYYCSQEEHIHGDGCYDETGGLICEQAEHTHEDACLTESPVYYCSQEEHIHGDGCYDETGSLICEQAEHTHEDACLTELPVYYCGQEEHIHGDGCYDETGSLICEQAEHTHEDACLTEPPVYYCGQEEHIHGDGCYDETGSLICEQAEHTHDEICQQEPKYYCGLEVHTHDEICYDESGSLVCERAEHTHAEACLQEPKYYCGHEEHTHGEACYDADEKLICEKPEHTHTERCKLRPMMSAGPKFYCGLQVHTHEGTCYDGEGKLICEIPEHSHVESCTVKPPDYICGLAEHIHTDACRDAAGGIICGRQEHSHSSLCLVDLSDLNDYSRERVENVIRMIDGIPSADEYDAKIAAFEEAEDFEAMILWETEAKQKILDAYCHYIELSAELQERIVNRDKLLELEYIWSVMPLPETYNVFLDGTNGDLSSLGGRANTQISVSTGTFTLPTFAQWKKGWPDSWKRNNEEYYGKYDYTVRGWYNITDGTYHQPGEEVAITKHTVFYADWVATSYNIGKFNAEVVDTVSTNSFITTRMFDYSSIINMYSSTNNGTAPGNSHKESWSITGNGLIMRDWDEGGSGRLSYPTNIGGKNTYAEQVTQGLWSRDVFNMFFNPNASFNPATKEGIMGMEYLGTADHLFQYDSDRNSEHFGYYYYDSSRNAASYNQSEGRFYVYNYLERARNSDANSTDFLPLNSPYANTNGRTENITTVNSQKTYMYDNQFSQDACDPDYMGINYWFGMSTEIRFFLPQKPGDNSSGSYGNRSIYGDQMEFRFSGDDDVWILIDDDPNMYDDLGLLVLDIGGIHQAKEGIINFSTGRVTVDGAVQEDITDFEPGEYYLRMFYMERGASQSNCHLYFNISPRFALDLHKEDLLNSEPLEAIQFDIFTDIDCTQRAILWESREAYENDAEPISSFVTNAKGHGSIWGFTTGSTYYIRETVPEDSVAGKEGYRSPTGLIKMELSNSGIASYTAAVIPETGITDESIRNPSAGFKSTLTVDEVSQTLNLNVTNSLLDVDTRKLFVQKIWQGSGADSVTVHLVANDVRIRSVELNKSNNWQHTWKNLPIHQGDTETPIVYTVEEDSVPGYVGQISPVVAGDTFEVTTWEPVTQFETGQTYLLQTSSGYLATREGKLTWSSDTDTPAVLWTVESVGSGDSVTLKNGEGYYLRSNSSWSADSRYFYASKDQGSVTFNNSGFYVTVWGTKYYMTERIDSSNGRVMANNPGVQMTLQYRAATSCTVPTDGYIITNTPVPEDEQVSMTVTKKWTDRDGETAFADESLYEQISVPIRLLANGVDTGQTGRLRLQNGWTHTFTGLPRTDANGTIQYTVREELETTDWVSQVVQEETGNNNFAITVKNIYSRMVQIPVQKVWDNAVSGAETPPVTIHLYAVNQKTGQAEVKDSVVLNPENNWQGVFSALPPEEIGSLYYLYEYAQGYAPTYEHPDTIFIDNQRVRVGMVPFDEATGQALPCVITNYIMEELPATGGSGTTQYTAGGLLLMAAALVLLYNKKFKRRREVP